MLDYVGLLRNWHIEILQYWYIDILIYFNIKISEISRYWNIMILECWNNEILEYCNIAISVLVQLQPSADLGTITIPYHLLPKVLTNYFRQPRLLSMRTITPRWPAPLTALCNNSGKSTLKYSLYVIHYLLFKINNYYRSSFHIFRYTIRDTR